MRQPLAAHLAPDLDLARRYLESQELPGSLVLVGVTGAHHYGFPSPDSDLDLKGIHLAPARQLLGLKRPRETWDRTDWFDDVECDLTCHEAAKALSLLTAGNGNMLERILSPFQVVESDRVQELQALARASVGTHFVGHYRGYMAGMRREHARDPRVKSMLYVYRVGLTGVHLLRTGELEADVRLNAPRYGFPEVLELVDLKARSEEKAGMDPAADERFRAGWQRLEELLSAARDESSLPAKPPNVEDLNEWLVQARLVELG